MKANELMIGDWVECVDSTHKEKVYAQIDAIEEGQTCILVRLDNVNWFLDISFIKPIPLTAEILSKLGFKKKGHLYGIYDDYFDFEMYEYNDGTWLVSYHCCEMSLPDEQLLICYIHQLQHFMRHCGIEKTIEL